MSLTEARKIRKCVSHLKKISISSLVQEIRNKYDLNTDDLNSENYTKFQKERDVISFDELQSKPIREYYLPRIKGCNKFRFLFKKLKSLDDNLYNQIFKETDNVIEHIENLIFEKELNNNLNIRSLIASAIYFSCKNLGINVTMKEIMGLFKVGADSIRKYKNIYIKNININTTKMRGIISI